MRWRPTMWVGPGVSSPARFARQSRWRRTQQRWWSMDGNILINRSTKRHPAASSHRIQEKRKTTIPMAHVVTARDTADNKKDDIAGDFMVFWMIQSDDRDDFLLCAADKLIKEMKLNEKNPEREFLLGDGDEKWKTKETNLRWARIWGFQKLFEFMNSEQRKPVQNSTRLLRSIDPQCGERSCRLKGRTAQNLQFRRL